MGFFLSRHFFSCRRNHSELTHKMCFMRLKALATILLLNISQVYLKSSLNSDVGKCNQTQLRENYMGWRLKAAGVKVKISKKVTDRIVLVYEENILYNAQLPGISLSQIKQAPFHSCFLYTFKNIFN